MNADNVRLWLEDLESNQHPQTSGALCRLDEDGEVVGYCCLGRACEVAIAHGVETEVTAHGRPFGRATQTRQYDGAWGGLPERVLEWLGLPRGSFCAVLASKNDAGATFPEIAEYIRERLGM